MTHASPPPPRYAGLDGLRAIAVILVVVYHLFPESPLRGGFVGVDVFFVISGFLITSLLLRPSSAGAVGTGTRLLDFWRRRARRLLPALLLVVTVCASVAWIIGGDLLVHMDRQVLGAATFSYNWVSVASGTDYFAATAPELFRNFWSLAVEEQFYVLWPLLLPLVLLVPGRVTRVASMVALAAASAWWMSELVASGAVTRAYFGTDSHAFGLLLGIALAFLVTSMPIPAWMRRPAARSGSLLLGTVGIAAVVVAALLPETGDARTFPGSLLLASLGTTAAIAASVWPASWFGRGIDVAPLRWIGDRSYGIYLWHWPVLVLVLAATQGAGPEAGVPAPVGLLVLAITIAAAALSYRFVESPLRRLGLRRALGVLGRRIAGSSSTRFAGLALLSALALVIGGTTAAVASAQTESSAAEAIRAGQEALKTAADTPAPEATPTSTPDPTAAPDAAPSPAPTPVLGTDVTAVGDSVMLASAPSLYERLPGIAVDAAVSRSIWTGPGIIEALESAGQLRPYVVVALGTNGPVDRGVLEKIAAAVGPGRDLILVNAFAPRKWIPEVNADLAAFAADHRRVTVADWAGAIESRTDLLAGDNIHPGRKGGDVFAETVAAAIERVEAQRAADERRLLRAPEGWAPRVPFPG